MTDKVLVTGGNGYLGMQIILALLNQGYEVRATLRSLTKQADVWETLRNNQVENSEKLSFIQADLAKDEGWEEAMAGITYVLSVASPLFDAKNKDLTISQQSEEGTLRILKAAARAKVKRVVMTANFGAVGFSNKDRSSLTTEANWTNPDEKGLSAYEKSKLLAEKAAWKFIEDSNTSLELTTINPVAIMGASLNEHVSGSFVLLNSLFNGSPMPNLPLNLVNVRDVADLHVRAMTHPQAKNQRFIATEDGQISMAEIIALIKKKRPELAKKMKLNHLLPNTFVKLGALFNASAQEGKLMLEINRNVSNQKAKDLLGWQPLSNNEETILESLDTLEKYHLIG
ncbi:aldehyde reductase [Enterococcus sp. DIV0660C]|uniref:SDR family oxidoreductase n=1 Tax=Enterococcus sp. DIV0660C TaxID=2230880 RepID=UPI001A90BA51|nr:aldehyde reductase [Enterococcus sp. DIV0660C]MBO0431125.1 aldehyde reductase [Enterococcus sp. DIV0660C]